MNLLVILEENNKILQLIGEFITYFQNQIKNTARYHCFRECTGFRKPVIRHNLATIDGINIPARATNA